MARDSGGTNPQSAAAPSKLSRHQIDFITTPPMTLPKKFPSSMQPWINTVKVSSDVECTDATSSKPVYVLNASHVLSGRASSSGVDARAIKDSIGIAQLAEMSAKSTSIPYLVVVAIDILVTAQELLLLPQPDLIRSRWIAVLRIALSVSSPYLHTGE
ncbi:hypothetical protein MJO29_012016 [Puccinia striiformis f. sp. tritici]|nr:hypothetical protein MJO29_012016 [Puccinia striiformis f. sp. tritici]